MSSVRSAIFYSSFGKYLLKLIALISSIIVARLLTPAEIGTFAIASSVVMLMTEFRILGANAFIAREHNLTSSKIRSAYGLTVLISWSLGFFIAVMSTFLADIYAIEEITIIFIILAISFFFAPYISIPHALLSREYKFLEITISNIASSLTQLLVTIVLINLGFSFFALAWGHFSGVIVQFLFGLYFTRNTKVYMPSFRGLKPIAKLGIYTTLGQALRKTQLTAPDMIIGRGGNPAQVGIFSRGLGFVDFVSDSILSGIEPVTLPYLANVKRNGESIVNAYIKAGELITGIVWPVLVVASLASLPAIRLLFGDQWDEAAPIASLVAFWAILKATHVLTPKALIACSMEGAMLFKEAVVFVALMISIIVQLPSGLLAVSYGFVFAGFVDLLLSSVIMHKMLGLNMFKYYKALLKSLFVSVLCFIATYIIDTCYSFSENSPLFIILSIVFVLPVVWCVSIFVINHPFKNELISIFLFIKKRFL